MSARKRSTWPARISLGRDEAGKQQFHWIGRFDTKRERDDALARARIERPWEHDPEQMTCAELVARYLDRYAVNKASSLDTATRSLKRFREHFGARPVASIKPMEAEDWARTVPKSSLPAVVAMFNYATSKLRLIDHNPFVGLGGSRGRGRANEAPPTVAELQRLLDACDALGDYAPQMRALITVAAYTAMRPGELYELRWGDIDLTHNRIKVERRLYRGKVDTPKNGRTKVIALPPPAREVLMRQPTRAGELVFVSKAGCRLSAPTMCQYWSVVRAVAGLDEGYDFYRCTKHFAVHNLYKLGLSQRAIGAQCGWSERAVEALLRTYGHIELVALAEIDDLYADLRDADVTQEDPDVLS